MRESNSHQRFWRPLSYHLTNPLQSIFYILSKLHTCWHFPEIHYFLRCWVNDLLRGGHFVTSPLSFFGQALTRLVTVSSMHCCTSTSALSTSSSSRGFTSLRMGYLILRGASRLDAFSVYPFRAWLLGRRLGSLTDAPAARPSRSSRTKDSSSQISYAHAG